MKGWKQIRAGAWEHEIRTLRVVRMHPSLGRWRARCDLGQGWGITPREALDRLFSDVDEDLPGVAREIRDQDPHQNVIEIATVRVVTLLHLEPGSLGFRLWQASCEGVDGCGLTPSCALIEVSDQLHSYGLHAEADAVGLLSLPPEIA